MFRPLLISMFLTSTALADTWTVDDDGKADFNNIQAAVDASSDGDEIIVMPGTYTGTGDIGVVDMSDKRVTLRSTDPDNPTVVAATIIDGENERRCIYLSHVNPLVIKGFTITNGYTESKGGGIFGGDGSPTVTDCTFSNNHAGIAGGGFYCRSGSPYIVNCMFESNTAQEGGAVKLYRSIDPHIISTSFIGNTAGGGGAINIDGELVGGIHVISDCLFDGNAAVNGGGLFIFRVDVQLLNDEFRNNTADSQGGAMWIDSSTTNIANCFFCQNSPQNLWGGWIDDGGNTMSDLCDDDDGDGVADETDNCYLYNPDQADCNENGIGDVCDIADGTSYDMNSNGIPDDCDDSDGDGVTDDIDAFPNDPNEWADSDSDGVGDNEDSAAHGACCVSTGCYQTTAVACDGLGGTWLDEGGSCDDCEAPPTTCAADLNGDGIVKVQDLLILIASWGACP